MDTFTMMTAKYEAMEREQNTARRALIHDAGNIAMQIIASEFGAVKMIGRFLPNKN